MIYMASPYSKYPDGRRWAAHDAAFATVALWRKGLAAYSPVVHGHALTEATGELQPDDQDWWFQTNEPMMAKADALVVAMLDGWDQSEGISREVNYFQQEGKPIFYYTKKELGLDSPPEI